MRTLLSLTVCLFFVGVQPTFAQSKAGSSVTVNASITTEALVPERHCLEYFAEISRDAPQLIPTCMEIQEAFYNQENGTLLEDPRNGNMISVVENMDGSQTFAY